MGLTAQKSLMPKKLKIASPTTENEEREGEIAHVISLNQINKG
jgi:hypothetical protein